MRGRWPWAVSKQSWTGFKHCSRTTPSSPPQPLSCPPCSPLAAPLPPSSSGCPPAWVSPCATDMCLMLLSRPQMPSCHTCPWQWPACASSQLTCRKPKTSLACAPLSLHSTAAEREYPSGDAGVRRVARAVDAQVQRLHGLLVDTIQPGLEAIAFGLSDVAGLARCSPWTGPLCLKASCQPYCHRLHLPVRGCSCGRGMRSRPA